MIGGRVVNCEFAETAGGVGILHSACDPWVIGPNSRFVRVDGVGVECHSSGVTIVDCNFENKAPDAGSLAQFVFQGQFEVNYTVAFASYMMALAPMLLVYVIAQRWVISGVTRGAIK